MFIKRSIVTSYYIADAPILFVASTKIEIDVEKKKDFKSIFLKQIEDLDLSPK